MYVQTKGDDIVHIASMLIIFAIISAGLYILSDMLFPLGIAFLVWFVTTSYRRSLSRLPLVGGLLSEFAKTCISFVIGIITLAAFAAIVMYSINQFDLAYATYSDNLHKHIDTVSVYTGLNIEELLSGDRLLDARLQEMFSLATGFFTTAILVLFYLMFIFFEEPNFREKLMRSTKNAKAFDEVYKIIDSITVTVHKYLSLKTLISIGTGLASYLVMVPVGLDFALLVGFLIFLFNYIPNLGPLIGTGIAVLFALFQFDTLTPAILILITVGIVQTVSGNIVEPLLMGSRLNLSPLVIMFALVFWGSIWGIFGMFIAVPLTVVLMIVFAHIEQTRRIAIWMSENGNVKY